MVGSLADESVVCLIDSDTEIAIEFTGQIVSIYSNCHLEYKNPRGSAITISCSRSCFANPAWCGE